MKKLALIAVFAFGAAGPSNADLQPGDEISFTEKLLGRIPDDVTVFKDISFSPNGRYVAYTAVKGGARHVVVNNEFGPAFTAIGDKPAFIKDGKTVIYRASSGSNWRVVVGEKPGPAMAMVGKPVFSPDLQRYAFEGSRGTTGAGDITAWSLFADGRKTGKEYASLGPPRFSADNKILAHTARMGQAGRAGRAFNTAYVMVINRKAGKPIGPDGKMSNPFFAPQGKKMAYRVREKGWWSMVVDKKPEGQYSLLENPIWSPDGKTCAYRASPDRRSWYTVVGGKKRGPYQGVGDPVWRPDSSDVAYKLSKEGKWFVMIDGKEHGPYPVAENPTFSADSAHWAYPAIHSGKWTVIHDGKPGPADLDAIYGPPVLSPDGKRVAYQAGWKYKWIIVIDDGKNELFDTVGLPVWNPQGTKVAYAARKGRKWYMVVHYRRLEPFDEILTPPVWNAEGTKVAFGCRKERALTWRVVEVPQ